MRKKGKPRRPRSATELQKASSELEYEISMLFGALAALRNEEYVVDRSHRGAIENALIESFLIHARNLRDFYYRDPTRAEDLVASEFFAFDEHWLTRCPAMGTYLANSDCRQGLDRFLAHLSWSRVDKAHPTWDLRAMGTELLTPTVVFTTHVDKSKLCDTFIMTVENAKTLLDVLTRSKRQ